MYLRFDRAFEAVHDDPVIAECALSLPVAMAQNLDAGLHVEQTLLRRRQQIRAAQEVARNRLRVPASKQAAGHEGLGYEIVKVVLVHRVLRQF